MTSSNSDNKLSHAFGLAKHINLMVKCSEYKENLAKEMADALGAENVELYASFQAKIRKIAQDTSTASPPGFRKDVGSLTVTRLPELAHSINISSDMLRDEIQTWSTKETREVDEIVFARMLLDYLKNPPLGATGLVRSPAELYLITKRIITAYATRDPYQAHYEVVSSFLAKWGDNNEAPNLQENDHIRFRLAGELCRHAKAFKERLTWPEDASIDAIEGMFWLDHAFASYIETLGDKGREKAAKLRENSTRRFDLYKPTQEHQKLWYFWFEEKEDENGKLIEARSRIAETLTLILWYDDVKSEWERCRYDFPHLTHGSLATIMPALRPGNNVVVESMQNEKIKKIILYTSEGRMISETSAIRAAAESAITMIHTGAEILSSTLGIMLTIGEVAGFWTRYYNSGKDWQSWLFNSYEDLCQTFKLDYHKHGTAVRQILHAQANMAFVWPDGSVGPMISLTERPGIRKTKRPVITASYPITPRYSWDIERWIGDTRTSRDARWKIPIPDPSEFPNVVGSRNKTAEQLVLFLVMMFRVAENARYGTLVLTEEDWTYCTNEAGVSAALASKTLDGWVEHGHLVKLPTGGWWLGARQARLADIIHKGYIIADKGRKGILPPRKLRQTKARR